MLGRDVGVVGQQLEVKVEACPLGTERDATDRRQAVASIPARQQRRLALRGPGPTHGRRQHEAAFVEKHDVGIALAGGIDDLGDAFATPTIDDVFLAFAGATPWLLRRPFEPLPEKTTDVVVMQRHAEVATDQLGDASRGPEVIDPAMGLGALEQQPFEFGLLRGRQTRRRGRMRFGGEPVRLLRHRKPALDRTNSDAHDAGDILHAVACVDGLNGLASSLFKSTGGSIRSAHVSFYARPGAANRPSMPLRAQLSVGKPSLPATTRLTQQQIFALQENLQAVVNQSIPGYRRLIASGRPRAEVLKGLQNQMNLLRWRFIDQVPGGREAIQRILQEFPEITFPH